MSTFYLTDAWVIIPARGGSKGIPGKNLKKIQGRSLVARTVYVARQSHSISRVFVSTDDAAIAEESRRAGAEVIIRPEEIAGDTASSEAALLHALDVSESMGPLPETIVFLQCTSPFVTAGDIDGTVAAFRDAGADTAHTVVGSHGFLWSIGEDGGAYGVNHDKAYRPRRQDLKPEFLETGAVYVMRTAGFRVAKHRFFGKTVLYEVPAMRSMEIDDASNLELARSLAPLLEPSILSSVIPDALGGVVFDFDGVMTDDKVILEETGHESVTCSRSDGMGIGLLKAKDIPLAVISNERNPVVARRCDKLGMACVSACDSKLEALRELCLTWNTDLSNIIFVGNDLPDVPCIKAAGLGVAVADAHPAALAVADLVLHMPGGQGAVRELCELILAKIGINR